jgi:hypothetical protein
MCLPASQQRETGLGAPPGPLGFLLFHHPVSLWFQAALPLQGEHMPSPSDWVLLAFCHLGQARGVPTCYLPVDILIPRTIGAVVFSFISLAFYSAFLIILYLVGLVQNNIYHQLGTYEDQVIDVHAFQLDPQSTLCTQHCYLHFS